MGQKSNFILFIQQRKHLKYQKIKFYFTAGKMSVETSQDFLLDWNKIIVKFKTFFVLDNFSIPNICDVNCFYRFYVYFWKFIENPSKSET